MEERKVICDVSGEELTDSERDSIGVRMAGSGTSVANLDVSKESKEDLKELVSGEKTFNNLVDVDVLVTGERSSYSDYKPKPEVATVMITEKIHGPGRENNLTVSRSTLKTRSPKVLTLLEDAVGNVLERRYDHIKVG